MRDFLLQAHQCHQSHYFQCLITSCKFLRTSDLTLHQTVIRFARIPQGVSFVRVLLDMDWPLMEYPAWVSPRIRNFKESNRTNLPCLLEACF